MALTREQVKSLQRALVARGFSVGPTGADGVFGTNTQRALQNFQRDRGLPVRYDGSIDGQTQAALGLDFSTWQGVTPTPRSAGAGQDAADTLSNIYGVTLASAVAAVAAAPLLLPLAPVAAGMIPVAGATGLFATGAGVVYRQVPDGTGKAILQKTGQTIFDFAGGAGLGLGLGTVALIGAGLLVAYIFLSD